MFSNTVFQAAHRYVGVREAGGVSSNLMVLAMLRLDAGWVEDDQTPWCSAFVNFVCWTIGAPRSRSLAARSWLLVGQDIPLTAARAENDVVVLTRGKLPQPPATVLQAAGHVGVYAGQDAKNVLILGGNQGDSVSIASYPKTRILGIRRLA
jgi:uncharacterized protein (TIGR02594 family)